MPFAAAIPFCLSLVFHAVGAVPQRFVDDRPRPGLTFGQYMVHLGPVEPQPSVFARFDFTNTGDESVRIVDLQPSCGCLNPRLAKKDYAPGESGQFYLQVRTANQEPGLREYTCKVLYEDPAPREETLTFKVILPDSQVVVRPRALVFYQFGRESTTREVMVHDARPEPLGIVGVHCDSKLVTARIGESTSDEQGINRTRIEVTVTGQVPPGRHQAVLTIDTDDPKYEALQVPLLIHGRDPVPRTAVGPLTNESRPEGRR